METMKIHGEELYPAREVRSLDLAAAYGGR
jgi:hypothetical protein